MGGGLIEQPEGEGEERLGTIGEDGEGEDKQIYDTNTQNNNKKQKK